MSETKLKSVLKRKQKTVPFFFKTFTYFQKHCQVIVFHNIPNFRLFPSFFTFPHVQVYFVNFKNKKFPCQCYSVLENIQSSQHKQKLTICLCVFDFRTLMEWNVIDGIYDTLYTIIHNFRFYPIFGQLTHESDDYIRLKRKYSRYAIMFPINMYSEPFSEDDEQIYFTLEGNISTFGLQLIQANMQAALEQQLFRCIK